MRIAGARGIPTKSQSEDIGHSTRKAGLVNTAAQNLIVSDVQNLDIMIYRLIVWAIA